MQTPELAQVVIIGRPNVGKSTLFNRIIGRRQAIVGEQSGLTRDRHQADAEWAGRRFQVSDTGGVERVSDDELTRAVEEHAGAALVGATAAVLVVDAREGIVAVERDLAVELLRRGVPAFLAVNKCDNWERMAELGAQFAELGLDPVFPMSAEQGHGVADMLDAIVQILPESAAIEYEEAEGDRPIRVAVVGRPNVGKSSLVNAMLGMERVVVSAVSGTTRDAIDTPMQHRGRDYVLVDTAGIRRGARQDGFVEMVSVTIARRRMQRADVALLVVDAAVGLTRQDRTVADAAQEAGCALVVVVNKWDLVQVQRGDKRSWLKELQERLGRMSFARLAYTSALTGDGIDKLFDEVDSVAANRMRRVPTGKLNALFDRIARRGPGGPPGAPRLKYATQASVAPPTFVVFVGRGRRAMPDSYARFLENRLREEFDLGGTPIRLFIRGPRPGAR